MPLPAAARRSIAILKHRPGKTSAGMSPTVYGARMRSEGDIHAYRIIRQYPPP
jgi:hypothetical protein